MKRAKQIAVTLLVLLSILPTAGCWETAEPGMVKVQTIWDKPTAVIRGQGIWTITTIGDDYYEVSTKTFTHPLPVSGSTKDNAAVKLDISVTAHTINEDWAILKQVDKFGASDPADRAGRILSILDGMVSTKVKEAIVMHDAYQMLIEQQAIQKNVEEAIRSVAKDQLFLEIESVQITGRPYFQEQEIEAAASRVVAAVKKKQAAQAEYEAEEIAQKRKQLEAATFARSPQTLELEKMDRQIKIAEAWAKHSGSLIFGAQGMQTLLGKE